MGTHYDQDMTVEIALKQFYAQQGIDIKDINKSVNYFNIGPIKLPFPNFKSRQRSVFFHDINHLLTGFDISFSGEGKVAAFELKHGFPAHCWIGYLYAPFALLGGLITSPIQVLKVFTEKLKFKPACHLNKDQDAISKMTIKEIKNLLKI